MNDPLDDFYAAIGQGLLEIAVTGVVTRTPTGFEIAIDAVGVYLRDTYDFNDDRFMSQPLGFWGFGGVSRHIQLRWDVEIDPLVVEQKDAHPERLYAVQNDDFRSYRGKYKMGGDFVLYSDVKVTSLRTPLLVRL